MYLELAKKDIAIAEIENNLDAALRLLEQQGAIDSGSREVNDWKYLLESQVETPSPTKVRSPIPCISPVKIPRTPPIELRLGSTSQSHCDGTLSEDSCPIEEREDSPL